jgi:2-polyprenyl-6-hydroxyphenyl methylase/3-demethylubiquinone-9 3-methyltransferase
LLAPVLGIQTQHLSTDRFLDGQECVSLLQSAGLRLATRQFWTFIPRADMPRWSGVLLQALDGLGRVCRLSILRGGLMLTGLKGV